MTTRAVLRIHLLLLRSSRNSPAIPLHLVHHLPVVLVRHRRQVARDQQRPLRVMGGPQPRLRQVIRFSVAERRSSTLKTTYVRNVRSVHHVPLTIHPHFTAPTRKGQNTGYKNNDPSHPCRKCWDRFSRIFTSVLASSPWGDQASGSASHSQRGRTFQRPLPAFKPPQAQAQPRPMPGSYPPHSPSGTQSTNPRPIIPAPLGGVPPPGSTVVMPGDVRIGGRLCWRCGGRGTTPFLIFDEMTCETCGGIGRLVN